MILYLLVCITVLIILFFVVIRLKHRFWSIQPVFHFYDVYYWFVNVGVINSELPLKNRYVNCNKIKTKTFDTVDELTKKQLLTLIQINYLQNGENKYEPLMNNFEPYFIGHNHSTFVSYFVENEVLLDNKNGKVVNNDRIIGVITSRPLSVKINCGRKDSTFDVYYVDYLCVDELSRKNGVAPQLIQTHEYKQSHSNRKICVSLFKREEELTGIIPLTVYKTYCFEVNKIRYVTNFQEQSHSILTCDSQNIYYLYNFFNELDENKFDILINPSISNLIELIKTGNIYVKMLLVDGNIEAIYVFRKTCVFIKKNCEILSCIGSIKGPNVTNNDFTVGFKCSLQSILNKCENFKYIVIEDISDNQQLINEMCITNFPIIISPMAYFFYNFAYNPFNSSKCFIIN